MSWIHDFYIIRNIVSTQNTKRQPRRVALKQKPVQLTWCQVTVTTASGNVRILPSLPLPTHPYTSAHPVWKTRTVTADYVLSKLHLDSFMCDSCHESAHHTLGRRVWRGLQPCPSRATSQKIRLEGRKAGLNEKKPSREVNRDRMLVLFPARAHGQKRKSQRRGSKESDRTLLINLH